MQLVVQGQQVHMVSKVQNLIGKLVIRLLAVSSITSPIQRSECNLLPSMRRRGRRDIGGHSLSCSS